LKDDKVVEEITIETEEVTVNGESGGKRETSPASKSLEMLKKMGEKKPVESNTFVI